MGLMDKVKQAVRGRSGKLEQGIDKAVRQVDQRTGGKYGDKLTKGAEALKEQTRKLDDERRDAPGATGPGTTTAPGTTGPGTTGPAATGPSTTGPTTTGPTGAAPADLPDDPRTGRDEPPVV